MTGRGLILGGLRASGQDPAALFTGEGHAPAPLSRPNRRSPRPPRALSRSTAPTGSRPRSRRAWARIFAPVMERLRDRAPVFLRVNIARLTRPEAAAALADEGIETRPHPLAATALEVTSGARRIQASRAYGEGLVELQDAASQAVVEAIPLSNGLSVLDYCAGGGGKTLALAARARLRLTAHDGRSARMRDLPARAARAGAHVRLLAPARSGGPGPSIWSWPMMRPVSARAAGGARPKGKWALTPARLAELTALQAQILRRAAALVKPGASSPMRPVRCWTTRTPADRGLPGGLAGLAAGRPEAILTPLQGGDGFFLARLERACPPPRPRSD